MAAIPRKTLEHTFERYRKEVIQYDAPIVTEALMNHYINNEFVERCDTLLDVVATMKVVRAILMDEVKNSRGMSDRATGYRRALRVIDNRIAEVKEVHKLTTSPLH